MGGGVAQAGSSVQQTCTRVSVGAILGVQMLEVQTRTTLVRAMGGAPRRVSGGVNGRWKGLNTYGGGGELLEVFWGNRGQP